MRMRMVSRLTRGWVGVACVLSMVLVAGTGYGQDIRIVKRGSGKSDIDLSGLQATGQAAGLKAVLREDLERSGWFVVRDGGATIAVRGTCTLAGDSATIEAEVVNVATSSRFLGQRYGESASQWRRASHRLADDIVKAVTGKRGIASTRIALIGTAGGGKNVWICDADGQGMQQITRDNKPCMTPTWTPDMRSLFYMSFHRGYPDIYRIDLASRRRDSVSRYPGINTGPAVSPNGGQLALILSRDSNAELYVMQLGSGRLQRLTQTRHATEACPTWSPDGNQIAYVSDRSGTPHVYTIAAGGGTPRKVTMRGSENVNPDWGPDGRLAYSSRREGRYQVCVLNPATGEDVQLTGGGADYEEPSWAPDARHIVAARTVGYRADLYVLDTLGDPEVRLTTLQGDWYSPAWSPR